MGDWPIGDSQESTFLTSVAVTPNATANTYGSWAPITTSMPRDVTDWDVHIYQDNAVDGVLDLGLGGSGSEQVIVSLPFNMNGSTEPNFRLPLYLPAGARLSARMKVNAASGHDGFPDLHFYAGPSLIDGAPRQRAATYGITNSSGVAVSSASSAGVQGTWTTITSSSTNRTKLLIPCVQPNTNGASEDVLLQMDIGIGGSGSTVDATILTSLYWYYQFSRYPVPNSQGPFSVDIPAGTRIAARLMAPNNNTTFTMQVALIGID